MKTVIELIDFLNAILNENSYTRPQQIKIFQDYIWNDESIVDEKLNEFLSELAYDLDFYEPNDEWRKESPNYYNDEILEQKIMSAVQELKKIR
jgi:hypothetical protein